MMKPPSYVSDIKPYVPGKPVEELERELGITDSVKLASNENPLGPSPLAMQAVKEYFSRETRSHGLNRYPDGSGYYLKQALAKKLSVDPEEIILGSGSNELLDIAARTFLAPGDEAVMAHPSFVVYQLATKAIGATPVIVPLRDFTHDLNAMGDAITRRTRIIFIANPNNPTGTINRRDELEGLMKKVPEGVLVVMDEAYYEYVLDPEYPDSMRYFREGRDVLILRTFSKIYGLAGLRIGYGIARKDILIEMNKLRPPFNTSTIAQKAAIAALEDDKHVKASRETNEKGKEYLYAQFDSLGLGYVRTEANFVYLPLEEDSGAFYNRLLKQGIIVRPMGPREVRVTIGLPEENERLVASLKKVLHP